MGQWEYQLILEIQLVTKFSQHFVSILICESSIQAMIPAYNNQMDHDLCSPFIVFIIMIKEGLSQEIRIVFKQLFEKAEFLLKTSFLSQKLYPTKKAYY